MSTPSNIEPLHQGEERQLQGAYLPLQIINSAMFAYHLLAFLKNNSDIFIWLSSGVKREQKLGICSIYLCFRKEQGLLFLWYFWRTFEGFFLSHLLGPLLKAEVMHNCALVLLPLQTIGFYIQKQIYKIKVFFRVLHGYLGLSNTNTHILQSLQIFQYI